MQNFTAILTDLRAAIAGRAACDRAMTAILVLVWGRLARAAVRLERLYGLWLAGRLRAPRKAGVRTVAAQVIARPRVPHGRGWLAFQVWETRAYGSQLQHLLADPGFAAFVAAVPRAGGVLRPILRMLTVDALPAILAKPTISAVLPKSSNVVPGAVTVVELGGRKREKPQAAVGLAWPRKVLPRLPKGAWFEPPCKNWGSGR
ncbi:MAG: hypothetical protein H7251_09430 [Acetobacteraceae bacterium]|nr:hypothetical protein [Acetobacteraceae bacterium]